MYKCIFCDIDSPHCEIFHSFPYTDSDWYLKVETSHWDEVEDKWDYEKVYINYCPYCGRRLSGTENN